MNLTNTTPMAAAATLGMAKDGRESVVVVVKGTFGIPPRADREAPLLEEQAPLITTDVFTGDPGVSAALYEMDFAPRKPRCDVLLHGSAYSPGGKPATRVPVSLQVGPLLKGFAVVGNRTFKAGLLYRTAGEPEPFTVLPISYDRAYGGVDRPSENPADHKWFPSNHAGVGYHPGASAKALDGKPLPNTEESGQAVSRSNGNYRPMAFGPVARTWQPRVRWAGTYDQKWREETAPFLPADFDDRYFQAAPEDQQIDFPRGGEEVVLTNLTPAGRTAFRLPRLALPVVFFLKDGPPREVAAVVDTIILEPDKDRFLLVWRAGLPLRRSVFEVVEARVGKTARHWQRLEAREQRTRGKIRVPSLTALAAWNRQQVTTS